MNVACQPVEFGDDQGGAGRLGMRQRCGELWAIVPAAAFDLHVFGEQPAASDMARYGVALRFEAEAAFALALGRHTEVADEGGIHRRG